MSAESDFERAGDLAGATVRPAGDTTVVEVPHGQGVYSRFAPDASCRIRTYDNGRQSVVVDLAHGDGWFEVPDDETVIEVRRSGAVIVAAGAVMAVKGESDGRTIVVAVDGDVTVQPATGDQVVLRGQAAMLDGSGRVGQVVDVSPEQVAHEPWIARNRGLEPMPVVEAEPEPESDVEPEPEVEPEADAELALEPEAEVEPEVAEPEAVEAEVEPEAEPEIEAEAEPEPEPEVEAEPEVEVEVEVVEVEAAAEPEPESEIDPEPEEQPEPEIEAVLVPDAITEPVAEVEPEPEPELESTAVVWAGTADDEPVHHRRWPRVVVVGVLLIAAIALLLPRLGSDDPDDQVSSASIIPPETAVTTVAPPTETTAATTVEPSIGEPATEGPETTETPETTEAELPRSDAPYENELVACRRAGGQVTFTGRLTNHENVDRGYRLHVIFSGAGGAVVERRQLDFDVASGETQAWQVTSSSGGSLQGGSCDLERVEVIG